MIKIGYRCGSVTFGGEIHRNIDICSKLATLKVLDSSVPEFVGYSCGECVGQYVVHNVHFKQVSARIERL